MNLVVVFPLSFEGRTLAPGTALDEATSARVAADPRLLSRCVVVGGGPLVMPGSSAPSAPPPQNESAPAASKPAPSEG